MRRYDRTLPLIIVLLVLLVAAFAPTIGAALQRWVIDIDEPFEFDGQVYSGGTVVLKYAGALNPATVLTEVWVGNRCLGLVRAHRVAGEAPADMIVFERRPDGRLVLAGYSSPGHGVHGVYRFGDGTPAPDATMIAAR